MDRSGLKVLGAGLPRTGTASMRKALEILGYGPCYHMFVVFEDADRSKEWQRIYKEIVAGNDSPDFTEVFRGFPSAVDAPASEVWQAILKQYPDVKVILTTRDAKAWWNSCEGTINNILNDRFVYPNLVFWVPRMYQQWKWARVGLLPLIKQRYGYWGEHVMEKRIKEVRQGVPASHLLEYKLGSGWEPLCEFLGVPIPDEPFPNVNDKNEISKFFESNVKIGLKRWAYVVGTCAVAAGLAFKLLNRR